MADQWDMDELWRLSTSTWATVGIAPADLRALLAAAREGAEWVRGMEEGLARGLEHRRSAEARIKELCAALERIAADDAGANVGWMREIARAALAGKGEDRG